MGGSVTNLDVSTYNLAKVVLNVGDALDEGFITMKASHNVLSFVLV